MKLKKTKPRRRFVGNDKDIDFLEIIDVPLEEITKEIKIIKK